VFENFLKQDLQQFDPGVHIIVVVNGCSSGSFVDSIMEVADVTVTATSAYDPSYGDIDNFVDDPNPDDEGSEFVSGYVEDWNEIMGDEAQQEEARQRAQRNGTNFWEEVSTLAYVSALEKDAAYREGWTFPNAVRGAPGTKPTASPTPTQSATPMPTPTESALAALGKYLADVIVEEDEAGHAPFIEMPTKIELVIRVGSISIEGPFPWVAVGGEIEADGSFDASGRGTVAGFPNIAVTFQGSVSEGRLEGRYTMGAEGGLPQGLPIVYSVNGERTAALETSTPEPSSAAAETFAESFNAYFQDADVEGLLSLLHPAVIELYGSGACREYLSSVVATPVKIEVIRVLSIGPWLWEIDGRSTLIEEVYTVQAEISAAGQSNQRSLHFGVLEDGSIAWFSDCGEPLP
jgi:hypothetical protein